MRVPLLDGRQGEGRAPGDHHQQHRRACRVRPGETKPSDALMESRLLTDLIDGTNDTTTSWLGQRLGLAIQCIFTLINKVQPVVLLWVGSSHHANSRMWYGDGDRDGGQC